jgi:hypothetical protein
LHTDNHVKKRRLSRAIGADDTEYLTFGYVKRDVIEGA